MPDNNQVYTNKSGHLVEQIRERFSKLCESELHLFTEEDVYKVLNDDWFVKRFLIARGRKVDDAYKMLIESLKWRKSISLIDDTYFPEEFYKMGGIFSYARDINDNCTIYIRVKCVVKAPEINSCAKKFGEKVLYNLDADIHNSGLCVIVDFGESGLQNADFDVMYHAIYVLKTYFPAGLNQILVVDLPWVLKWGYAIIRSWIPENRRKLLKFVSRKSITDYIAKENLPDFLGGTCTKPYKGYEVVPKGCPNVLEFALNTLGLQVDRCKKLYNMYKPIMEEVGVKIDTTILDE